MKIRTILPSDNIPIGNLIQNVLEEHKANLPGTAYFDKELFSLSEVYNTTHSRYFIIEENNVVVGGGGINSFYDQDPSICELQKLYLSKEVRGKGYGRQLIEKCLTFAKEAGFKSCYLETMPQLSSGVNLYYKVGFKDLEKPIGNTLHHGCSIWMIKTL